MKTAKINRKFSTNLKLALPTIKGMNKINLFMKIYCLFVHTQAFKKFKTSFQ